MLRAYIRNQVDIVIDMIIKLINVSYGERNKNVVSLHTPLFFLRF